MSVLDAERRVGEANVHAVHMQCTCSTHAVHMPCICRAHAVHMQCMRRRGWAGQGEGGAWSSAARSHRPASHAAAHTGAARRPAVAARRTPRYRRPLECTCTSPPQRPRCTPPRARLRR
eukprot:scaffold96856_cov63-Phaeocystis_antarctica.AAC.1